MTATVAEMKVQQLKRELADAEAAHQVTKTLTSELAEADKALGEAQRLVTLNQLRLDEAVAGLEALSKESIPQGMSQLRSNNDVRTQQANRAVRELTIESDSLAGELRKKQLAVGLIVKKIEESQAYKTVREKQRGLVAEATKLAPNLLKVPLNDLDSVLKQISILSEAENRLISNARSALCDGGLPGVKPLLALFLQQVTPRAVLDALPGIGKENREAIRQVTEIASRDVLR
jgi:hypothetical protein